MPVFVPRSEWNDTGNSPGGYGMGTVSQVVFHHTPGQDPNGDYNAARREVNKILGGHFGNGWSDIGYTFLVSGDYIFEGRGFGHTGAHAPGANSSSIGIAFILDGRYREPTPTEWAAAKWIVDEAVRQGYLTSHYTIYGHRDWVSTECPASLVYGNLHKLQSAVPGQGGGLPGGNDMGAHETAILEALIGQINIPATGWKFDDGTPIKTLPEFLVHLMNRQDRTLGAIRELAQQMANAANQDLNIEATGWKRGDGTPITTLPEFIHVVSMQQTEAITRAIRELGDIIRQNPGGGGGTTPPLDTSKVAEDIMQRVAKRLQGSVA